MTSQRRRTDIEPQPQPQPQARLDLFGQSRVEDLAPLPVDFDIEEFEVPLPLMPTIELYSDADLIAARDWCERIDLEAKSRAMFSLKALGGKQRSLALVDDCWRERMQDLVEMMPNFEPVIEWASNQFALSGLGDRTLKLPPLLLSGPGGVGKTAFAHALSDICGVEFHVFDMATSQTSCSLAGSEAHWSNSTTGKVWNWLGESTNANLVIFLDEVDKVGGGGTFSPATNALYSLLEPRSARQFVDSSIPPMRLDASHVIWIAACNNPDLIEPALRSRFREFSILPPTREQSRAIIASVYGRLRYENEWGRHFPEVLTSEIIEALAELPPRMIKQQLLDACGIAARHGRKNLLASDVAGRMSQPAKRRMGFV